MARVRINLDEVIKASSTAKTAEDIARNVMPGIDSTRWKLDTEIRSRGSIDSRLGNLRSMVEQIEKEIHDIYTTVNQGANLYITTESYALGMSRETANVQTAMRSKSENSEQFRG